MRGARHESASGEVAFDTEVFPSDPAWLSDHRVFGRLIAPGALYGAMAASATLAEGSDAVIVEDFQMQSALVFPDEDAEDDAADAGRQVQVLLDEADDGAARRVRILSRGDGGDGWTLHAEGRVEAGSAGPPQAVSPLDIEGLKAALSPVDLAAYYRAKLAVGIDLGPSFRTVEGLWARQGEAIAEVALPAGVERSPLDVHPLVLDGCFQAFGAARSPEGGEEGVTYLPFAWERLWLKDRLPERLVCHVQMRQGPEGGAADAENEGLPEVHAADLRLYDRDGAVVGELAGFTVKRATRAALLAAVEGIEELLYEVVWRDRALAPGMLPADFLAGPSNVANGMDLFTDYLANEDVGAGDRAALLADLENL
ncbi:MAG: polyketide synthase dehydratase domain-containing protein, partial [Rhodospirillales bacterium]|nr:polyketide synthase dehydratase domain-containing protein [Rhodospirillales bacterium]